MDTFIQYALLGLGIGSLYSLASQGLLLVYRGSGVLNFAQGAIGMAGAFVAWDVQTQAGMPYLPAVVVGVGVSASIGVLAHVLVMRPLRHAAPLARIVATLGILVTLQAIIALRYGTSVTIVASSLPTDPIELFGDVSIGTDRVILLGLAVAFTVALWAMYRFTLFGLATSATAENERAARAVGLSPDLVATCNWALGSGLAGLAAILIAPIVQLQVTTMTTLVLAAMAAALVAGFKSFPIALGAGIVIGVAQTVLQRYVSVPGLAPSVPFLVIIVMLVVTGRSLPLRDFFLQRLPSVGTGRVRPGWVLAGVGVCVVLIAVLPDYWQQSFSVTFGTALILLSIVVLTGYTGQISLAQYVIGGIGAYVAGRLVATQGWPFELALPASVIVTVPIGILIALPALRTRGINLAIVTLGLGTAIELMVFNNGALTGGDAGTPVGSPSLFGLDLDPIVHPARYAVFALAAFVVAALIVANLRRGRSGRRLIAVRTNERAAAALGISVPATKLYGFAVASGIAALGGVVIGFGNQVILYQQFTTITSITDVGWAVIGGIGYVMGPVLGAILAPGAVGTPLGNAIFSGIEEYIPLIGGVLILLIILGNQDGQVSEISKLGRRLRSKRAERDAPPIELPAERRERVPARSLEVRDLTVRFGGVLALDTLSLEVLPGSVVGLIGPNGAGKTTAIDAMTGFVAPSAGTITLDADDISGHSAARRARAGVSRSFQSLELFEDMTVLENLLTASDRRDRASYLRDLVAPHADPLPGEVVAAIREFGLESALNTRVEDLPYGQRRLLAIARAVATRPSILLLDEPAAGLSGVESIELARLVRRLADEWGMGVLLVEHNMDFVMTVCDRLVVLDFGRTIAHGSPEVIRNDPAVVAAYLGVAEDDAAGPSVTGNGHVLLLTASPEREDVR